MFSFLAVAALSLVPGQAAVHTETVEYRDGDLTLKGFVAYQDTTEARPGVLVVPEWWGLGEHARNSAVELAKLGYVALAVDMYGGGKLTTDPQEAMKWAGEVRNDRALMRRRIQAGLTQLLTYPQVNKEHIGAIGYCFGGTTVLELARSGADVDGVVSFHGALNSPTPKDANNIKGCVLVLHGANDPYVPEAEVSAFMKEMRDAKVDFQFNAYANAVHSFTNPEAGNDASTGAAYNETAAKRAWEDMKAFFAQVFSGR